MPRSITVFCVGLEDGGSKDQVDFGSRLRCAAFARRTPIPEVATWI